MVHTGDVVVDRSLIFEANTSSVVLQLVVVPAEGELHVTLADEAIPDAGSKVTAAKATVVMAVAARAVRVLAMFMIIPLWLSM